MIRPGKEAASQPAAGALDPVNQEIYYITTQDLALIIEDSTYGRTINLDDVEALAISRLHYCSILSNSFGSPSAASRGIVQNPPGSGRHPAKIVVPGSQTLPDGPVEVELSPDHRDMAIEISAKLGIDEIEAAMLCLRWIHSQESLDVEDMAQKNTKRGQGKGKTVPRTLIDELTSFQHKETLWACKLIGIILRRAQQEIKDSAEEAFVQEKEPSREDCLIRMAKGLRNRLVADDPPAFIANLFAQFAVLAQSVVPPLKVDESARTAMMHYLETQTAVLESLLLYLYYNADEIYAPTAIGLITASLHSCFGKNQANARLIQRSEDAAVTYHLNKIEALLGLISLEALGLPALFSGTFNDSWVSDILPQSIAEHDDINENDRRFYQSTGAIAEVHHAINQATPTTVDARPFPLLLEAWAFFLQSLPDFMVPGPPSENDSDGKPTICRRVHQMAMDENRGLFTKWKELLLGPLLMDARTGAVDTDAAIYKDSMEVLLRAFSHVIDLSQVSLTRRGVETTIEDVWNALYGQGDLTSVADICNVFWTTAEQDSALSDLLTHNGFPMVSDSLPSLLTSLTGTGSIDIASEDISGLSNSAMKAFEYMEHLGFIRLKVKEREKLSGSYFELPGGLSLEAAYANDAEDEQSSRGRAVIGHRCNFKGSGWRLLLSLLELALTGDETQMSQWNELGVTLSGSFAGRTFDLIERLGRVEAGITERLLSMENDLPYGLLQVLLVQTDICIQDLNATDCLPLLRSTLAILAQSAPFRIGRILVYLRDSRFFHPGGPGQRILIKVQSTQSYEALHALLHVIRTIADHAASDLYGVNSRFAKEQANLLRQMLLFVHEGIWTTHLGWTYKQPQDQNEITRTIANLYSAVIKRSTLMPTALPLLAAHQIILEKFVLHASPYDVNPIFRCIASSTLEHRTTNKSVGRIKETTLRTVLQLTDTVLSRHYPGLAPLARAFMDRQMPEAGSESPLETIVRIVTSAELDISTSCLAAVVLGKLSQPTVTAGQMQPGLLAYFQNPKVAVQRLHAVVIDPFAAQALVIKVWKALSSAVQSTPSLAYLCAGFKEDFSYGDTAIQDGIAGNSILSAAMQLIEAWESLWSENPAQLLAVLHFASSMLVGRSEMLSKFNADDNKPFWQALANLAAKETPFAADYFGLRDSRAATGVQDQQRYVLQKSASTCALELLTYVLEWSRGGNVDALGQTAMVSAALNLSSTEQGLRQVVEAAMRTGQDHKVMSETLEELGKRHASIPLDAMVQRWRESDQSEEYGRYDSVVEITARMLFNSTDAAGSIELLHTLTIALRKLEADDAFATAVATLVGSLAEVVHLKPEIATACARCAPGFAADLEAFGSFQDVVAATRQARQYQICADVIEISLTSIAAPQQRWDPAIRHLTEILPVLRLNEQLSQDPSLDQRLRLGLYRTILALLSLLPSMEAHDGSEDEEAKLGRFLDSLTSPMSQSLFYGVGRALAGQSAGILLELEIVSAIIELAWQKSKPMQMTLWLTTFDNEGIISHLFNLLIRDFPSSDINPTENAYAPLVLRILASIALIPGGAVRLVASGFIRAFDMTLTMRRAEGGHLCPNSRGLSYTVWTTMLEVMNSVTANLPQARTWIAQDLVPFYNKSALQLRYACEWSMQTDDCLLRLAETRNTLSLLRQTVVQSGKDSSRRQIIYLDRSLLLSLLASVSEAISSQKTLESILEASAATDGLIADGEEVVAIGKQDLRFINDSLLAIGADTVQILKSLTRASDVVCSDQQAWREVEHLILPVKLDNTSSIRVLSDFTTVVLDAQEKNAVPTGIDIPNSPLTQALAPMDQETRQMLIDAAVEGCYVVIVAQAVMITQQVAVEKERSDAAKVEGQDEKMVIERQLTPMDSMDYTAIRGIGSSRMSPEIWSACRGFLTQHVSVDR